MTAIKVCGVTRLEDAERAAALGAWAIGLIQHAPSPRACDPAAAEEIGSAMKRRVEVAGVFVNASLDEVAQAAERFSLTLLQLHGDEGPSFCQEAARRTGCKVMKAVRVKDSATIQALRPFHVDYHLLDAHVTGLRGGTGETFTWEHVEAHDRNVPVVLSGGLDPDNVGRGIELTRPFAVDSASGTEAEPGRKDPAKLEAFFRAVAAADARADAA